MARLRYFYGPMSSGKSTLALQMAHNYRAAARPVLLLTCRDRSGVAVVSSRLGICEPAVEVAADTDLFEVAECALPAGGVVVADEAQFYTAEQVDQLSRVVDDLGVDVDAYGILADFRTRLFPGSARLVELAQELCRLQVEVLCWCGRPGHVNSRLVDGLVVHTGEQVVVGDVDATAHVHYQVLCRAHWRARQPGQEPAAAPITTP